MSEAPAFLVGSVLSEDEERSRNRLISRLRHVQRINARQEAFYEGSKKLRDLGISIPPHLKDVEAVAAWPEIVVDVIDERMDWRGWKTPSIDLGLEQVYDDNHLDIEVGQGTLDSLIAGISYISAGTGDDGEPEVLVKAESPSRMTVEWDPRLRRGTSGLIESTDDQGRITGWTLYSLDSTVRVERRGGRMVVVERDEHQNNRLPIAVLRNRPRASRVTGRSEITRAVRSLTESGMRTLLGMEVAREFYGAPQRYMMGADESMFVDEDGNRKTQWDAILGRMLMAPRDKEGNLPEPGTFQAVSPQPFTEILKTLAQMMSAATGIPATHLGFTTDNPSSADAIARADMRLDKRAVRRQKQYDQGLLELANIVCLWRDGELPPLDVVKSLWVNPLALTPEAAADRASKMIGDGALDPSWDFTLEQYGLSDDDIKRVQQERLRTAGRTAIDRLAAAAGAARVENPDLTVQGTTDAPVEG